MSKKSLKHARCPSGVEITFCLVLALFASCASRVKDSNREGTYYVPWIDLGDSTPTKVTCAEGRAPGPPGLWCVAGEDWVVFKEVHDPSGVITRSWYTDLQTEYQRSIYYPDGGSLFLHRGMCSNWAEPAPGTSTPGGGGYKCRE